MAFTEEIVLRLGFNSGPAAAGLRNTSTLIKSWASTVKSQIAGAFAAGAVIGFFDKVINKFADLKDEAENLNVTTDFLQGVGKVADVMNSSADLATKALEKLNVKIGDARDGNKAAIESFERLGIGLAKLETMTTEEVFYAIADSMKASNDEAVDASRIIDVLGKKSLSMVTMMNQGGEALRQMIQQTRKLSEEDVKVLDDAKDNIAGAWNEILITGGKVLAVFANIAKMAGEVSVNWNEDAGELGKTAHYQDWARTRKMISDNLDAQEAADKKAAATKRKLDLDAAERVMERELQLEEVRFHRMTDEEQIVHLKKKQALAAEQMKRTDLDARDAAKAELDHARATLAVEEKVANMAAEKAKWEQWSANAAIAHLNALKAANDLRNNAQRNLDDAMSQRGDISLDDLANMDPSMLNNASRWKIDAANQVKAMRDEAMYQKLEGNDEGSKMLLNQSDDLAKRIHGLTPADADPLKELKEFLEEQDKSIKAMGAMAELALQGIGIPVVTPDE